MKNDEKRSNAINLAKHSFVFVLLYLGIILVCLVLKLIEKQFGSDNFIFTLLSPVFSLVILFLLISPLVIFICGSISLVKLLKAKIREKKPFFYALVSILFGITINGFIASIPISAFLRAHHAAQRIVCCSHLKILGSNCRIYQLDSEIWPAKNTWCDLTKSYIEDDGINIYLCPIDKIGPCSYAMNENIPEDTKELPGDLVVLFESAPGWNRVGGADDVVTGRHKKAGATIAFADGRVEFVKAAEIAKLRWTVDDKSVERQ